MAGIRTDKNDGILIIQMARQRSNALHAEMVEELNDAVGEAARDDSVRGLVLASGCPRFFSTGFDVQTVFRYDRETMTLFYARFIDLYESIYLLPKPAVAAVTGHAFAAGALLAVACDIRIFADGDFGFALNEVNLGLVPPPGYIRMLTSAVGPARTREILLTGDVLGPARSLEIGLAHELAAAGEVMERALVRARDMARKPSGAFAATKRTLRGISGHPPIGDDRYVLGEFIDHWFSEEAQKRRQELLASLNAKNRK